MSADVLRKRSGKFQRIIWWRNFREYVGAAVGIFLFSRFLIQPRGTLFRIAFVLFIAGMVWIVIQLRRKASARSMPAAIGNLTCIEFFRTEMERQRDVLKNVWPWYLAPLVPGFVVYTVAFVIAVPRPMGWAGIALLDALIATLFVAIWKWNLRSAQCLQRKIDDLNAAENQR